MTLYPFFKKGTQFDFKLIEIKIITNQKIIAMLMRLSKTPVQSSLSRMMDEFFNGNLPTDWDNKLMATQPSVNVVEKDDSFLLEVAAPGLEKGDFNITIEDDMLTISGHRKEETEEKESNYTKREFNYSSFSRSFRLPETCNSEEIKANYDKGVLNLTIPKKEEAKKLAARTIEIS